MGCRTPTSLVAETRPVTMQWHQHRLNNLKFQFIFIDFKQCLASNGSHFTISSKISDMLPKCIEIFCEYFGCAGNRCITPGHAFPFSFITTTWACYQLRKIKGCACAGNARNVFPATGFVSKRSRQTSRHMRDTRALMHVRIANPKTFPALPAHEQPAI